MTFVHKITSLLRGSLPKKLLYSFALLILISLFFFCIFYITSSYARLKEWYYSLNDHFYKKELWAHDFFTPVVKTKGNDLAIAGAGIAAAFIIYLIISWRRYSKRSRFIYSEPIDTKGWQWYLAVVLLAITLGIFSWHSMAPAYDEIFSAISCAELHPFQTISYYMLPNNHMYFNLINNVLFRWWGDGVQSGRLISLIAYIGILLCAFHWLHRLIHNYFYAFLALLPVAFQFTVWALSAQARGYEVQLFCAWMSFASLFRYAQTENDRMLKINMLFNILGFLMVSTYLLYYAAQTVILLCIMAYNRRFVWRYYVCQVFIICFVFLLYLPAFCFSGVAAFTDNPYVTPAFANVYAFLPNFSVTLKYLMNFCFSMLCGEDRAINFVLFFLPLTLYFSRNKERKLVAFCYTVLWVVFTIITLHMRRNPFNRNMIMHYSLTMTFAVYTFYVLVEKGAWLLGDAPLRRIFLSIFFVVPVLAYSCFLGISDKQDVSINLYYNNVNQIWANHTADLKIINPSATIWCGDDSYYMYYIFKKNGYKVARYAPVKEDYVILRHGEPFPDGKENDYTRICEVTENYEFYKRK